MKNIHQIIGIVHFFRMGRNKMSLYIFALITGLHGKILKLPWQIHTRKKISTLPLCLLPTKILSSTSQSKYYRALHHILNKVLGLHLMQLILFMGTILFNSTWARTFLVITEISNNSSLLKIHHLQSRPTRLVITSKCLHF